MTHPFSETARTAEPFRRALSVVILASIGGFVLYTAMVALRSAFVTGDFPESLAIKVERMPVIFPMHMVTGGLALILLPLAIAMRRQSRWHRLAGRIAAADVLISGVTAFPVAWVAPVTRWSAAGFSAQAATWLTLLGLGIWHVRHRRLAAHRTCMLLMTATAAGAIFFRVYLALFAIWGQSRWFETFYACDAWIAWLLPLGATTLVLPRRRTRGAIVAQPVPIAAR